MQALPFSFHELNTNNTKTIQNQKAFQKSILTTLHSNHNFVQREVFFKVTNTSLYTNQKETNQETS
jgi:hypothetical protein